MRGTSSLSCRVAFLITLAGLARCAPAQAASGDEQTFTSNEYGYTVRFPGSWEHVPAGAVDARIASLKNQPATRNIQWEAVYQSHSFSAPFTYPYVIMQVFPYPTVNGKQLTESQITQTVDAMTGGNAKKVMGSTGDQMLDSALSNATYGTAQYDATNHVVYQTISLNAPGAGQVRGVIIGHFGHSSIVSVMCYDTVSHFASSKPQFDKIASSFSFSPGFAYDPSANGPNPRVIGAVVCLLLVVAIIGVLVMLAVNRKKQRAPQVGYQYPPPVPPQYSPQYPPPVPPQYPPR